MIHNHEVPGACPGLATVWELDTYRYYSVGVFYLGKHRVHDYGKQLRKSMGTQSISEEKNGLRNIP